MKILHVLNTGKYSGAENVACQIIDLLKDDVDSTYCSLDGDIRNLLNEKKITFAPIKRMSVSELKRVLKECNPDIIHAHDMRSSFFAAMACGSIPLICHIHNNAFDSQKISLKSILFFFAALKSKFIFWVSDSAFSGYRFHSLFRKKSSILLNVIDIKSLYEKKDEDKNTYFYDVVYVGRLTYQKNPERLIDICKKLVERKENIKIAIVGDGELRESILQRIHNYNLERNVFMLGYKRNPLKIIFDSKVMLLTSRWEGLPMCVLEAMSLGTPIVSTPTDGIESVVLDGKTGFIQNSDEKIIDCLEKLINDSKFQQYMSEECRKVSLLHNNQKKYQETIMNIYKRSLKQEVIHEQTSKICI